MARTKNVENRENLEKNQFPDNAEESDSSCSGIPFLSLPPPSYGIDDVWEYEDEISGSEEEGAAGGGEEEGAASSNENNSNDGNTDSSDNDDNDGKDGDSKPQNSNGNGDSDYDNSCNNGSDNTVKKENEDDDNRSIISDISTDTSDSSDSSDDDNRNLSTGEKNDDFEAITSKALETPSIPSSSHSAITQAPISINTPTGALLYAPNNLSEKDLKQHGLTQLKIKIPDNSIGLKSIPSKRESSSASQTRKNGKTKKTRRAENVEEIEIKPRLNLEGKTAHLDITLPDEVDIFSLVIYTSSGIRNSLLLPLSTAPFRKLVDQTTTPKRNKTREGWNRIKGESLSWPRTLVSQY